MNKICKAIYNCLTKKDNYFEHIENMIECLNNDCNHIKISIDILDNKIEEVE